MSRPPIRIYVDHALTAGAVISLPATQSHYISTVMRQGTGSLIEVFDGLNGAWSARLTDSNRKQCRVLLLEQVAAQEIPADLWLCLAPLKKGRIDWAVEKACELGVARVRLVRTQRTIVDAPNLDRLMAHMIEAAEQCGRTHVPGLDPPRDLASLLREWPADRQLLFCDEVCESPHFASSICAEGPWAILIGPEGGFTADERDQLRAHGATTPVSLGPNILRADTAVVAALSLFQAFKLVR